jgi:SAM-dependent methyltransferase
VESLETITREGPVDRYMNARLTGDPGVGWQETIACHAPFRRGLMLGTTALRIEADILRTNPALHLTFVDLSDGPLRRRVELLGPRFPGRIDTRVADLNFLALPPESYDLVVSSSTLHHVTNLEHLAHQIDRTLIPDGVFFLQDYVGEARCTPSPAKKRVFELVYERDIARQRGRQSGLVWKDPSDLSPFCGVRSHEILEAMRAHLREEEVRTDGRQPAGGAAADRARRPGGVGRALGAVAVLAGAAADAIRPPAAGHARGGVSHRAVHGGRRGERRRPVGARRRVRPLSQAERLTATAAFRRGTAASPPGSCRS